MRMDVGIEQSSAMWDDSLTNISIGALLSEASLQGRFNNCDPKSNGSNAGLQPSQLISDSFDAFIAAHVNCSQGPRPPPQGSSSSILDAEDTRHAFPVQKFSSSGKDALALGGSTYSRMCSQDAGSKSFKYPNMTEVCPILFILLKCSIIVVYMSKYDLGCWLYGLVWCGLIL